MRSLFPEVSRTRPWQSALVQCTLTMTVEEGETRAVLVSGKGSAFARTGCRTGWGVGTGVTGVGVLVGDVPGPEPVALPVVGFVGASTGALPLVGVPPPAVPPPAVPPPAVELLAVTTAIGVPVRSEISGVLLMLFKVAVAHPVEASKLWGATVTHVEPS